jgi:hypothetical protein
LCWETINLVALRSIFRLIWLKRFMLLNFILQSCVKSTLHVVKNSDSFQLYHWLLGLRYVKIRLLLRCFFLHRDLFPRFFSCWQGHDQG